MIFMKIPLGWTFVSGDYTDESTINDHLTHDATGEVIDLQSAIKSRLQNYGSKSPNELVFTTCLGQVTIPIFHKRVPERSHGPFLAYAPNHNGKFPTAYADMDDAGRYRIKRYNKLLQQHCKSLSPYNLSPSNLTVDPNASSPSPNSSELINGSFSSSRLCWFSASQQLLSPEGLRQVEAARQEQRDKRRGPERSF